MPPILKRLGYGGSATIDSVQVLVTGGGLETSNNPSYLNMMDIPPLQVSRSRVLHADGTSVYTGSVSFDVTSDAVALFSTSKLLKRRYAFPVVVYDGVNATSMTNCQVTNLSVTGAAGGLISSSVSFMAVAARTNSGSAGGYILETDPPLGYWYSGGTEVRDWTLTMNQSVEPMYGNENTMEPKYLKTGLIDFTLDVNLYAEGNPGDNIIIQAANITLTGVVSATGHHFNGVTDLGTYSHSFVTAATDVASATIITG